MGGGALFRIMLTDVAGLKTAAVVGGKTLLKVSRELSCVPRGTNLGEFDPPSRSWHTPLGVVLWSAILRHTGGRAHSDGAASPSATPRGVGQCSVLERGTQQLMRAVIAPTTRDAPGQKSKL